MLCFKQVAFCQPAVVAQSEPCAPNQTGVERVRTLTFGHPTSTTETANNKVQNHPNSNANLASCN